MVLHCMSPIFDHLFFIRLGNNKRSIPFINVSHPMIVMITRQFGIHKLWMKTIAMPITKVITPQKNIVDLFFAFVKSLSRSFGFNNITKETDAMVIPHNSAK